MAEAGFPFFLTQEHMMKSHDTHPDLAHVPGPHPVGPATDGKEVPSWEDLRTGYLSGNMTIERILVPLDGSGMGESVLPYMGKLCQRASPVAILARIVEPRAIESDTSTQAGALQYARIYLEQVASLLEKQHAKLMTVARIGQPLPNLLAVAREEQVSLIAMATPKHLAASALPFGELGEQLLRSSPVPILAVPPSAQRVELHMETADQSFRSILVTTDGSETSDAIVPFAAEWALVSGAEIILLEVAPPAQTGRGEAEAHVAVEHHLGQLSKVLQEKRVPTECLIEQGDPAEAILEVARRRKVDLIAMNSLGSARRRDTAVGGVTAAVLRNASVPVLLTRWEPSEPRTPGGS
jgi:nucleotide-binding universal stress UspA family protein